MPECATCGEPISEGKKYCCKDCFYNRNRGIIPVENPIIEPINEQLENEGLITNDEPKFCEVCGSPVYLGRCSRFTAHPAPKKPKSR